LFSVMLNGISHTARKEWNMGSIQLGDRAPDFAVHSQTGQQVSLADYRGKSAVVLFFYPKDGTAWKRA
jgi:cytochrome oxidase Cu insertion factor (SCO1/SenC/PrrC family)